MAHQFLCPRGHLLQADESSGGAQCRCPHCGILFIIPPPMGRAVSAPPMQAELIGDDDSPVEPIWETESEAEQDSQSFVEELIADAQAVEADEEPSARPVEEPIAPAFSPSPDDLLHVVCPKGHRLQAPRRTLGRDVLCTVCRRRFTLTEKHTWEHLAAKAAQNAARERRLAQMWLKCAIAAAVLVVGALATLIALSRFR